MRKLAMALLAVLSLSATAVTGDQATAQIEGLEWLTEQYPPYNYVDEVDGQLKGITVDVLMRMFERCDVGLTREDIKVVPWARGYSTVLKTPGSALFSTTYAEERLQLLRFVGPVIPTRVSIIARRSRGLQPGSAGDLVELKIGTIRDDIGDQLVRALGAADLEPKNSAAQMVQMLHRGRLDAIAYADDIARHQFLLAGIDPDEYESVYTLHESNMGYAFHKDTDPAVLETLQTALDELRAEGVVDSISVRYLGPAQRGSDGAEH